MSENMTANVAFGAQRNPDCVGLDIFRTAMEGVVRRAEGNGDNRIVACSVQSPDNVAHIDGLVAQHECPEG